MFILKWAFSTLLVIGLFFTFLSYENVSLDLSRGFGGIDTTVVLRKGQEINFDIYIDGVFEIEILPDASANLKELKLSITDDGFFSGYKNLELSSFEGSYHYFLSADDKTKYTLKIGDLDKSLVNKKAKISVFDSGAPASMNHYYAREFRPFFTWFFKVSWIFTSIVFGILVIFFVIDWKKGGKSN